MIRYSSASSTACRTVAVKYIPKHAKYYLASEDDENNKNDDDAKQKQKQKQKQQKQKAASRLSDFPEMIPVFIVGMPRSGSTLLEQILGSHGDIDSVGENMYLKTAFDAAGLFPLFSAAISDAQILSGAKAPLLEDEVLDTIRTTYLDHVEQAIIAEERDVQAKHRETCANIASSGSSSGGSNSDAASVALVAKCSEGPPARRRPRFVVDKTLSNFEYLLLLRIVFPIAKIIAMQRDPVELAAVHRWLLN
jgi:hypothetical protein